MTSPDFRQYVDLTISDVQPGDIYIEALEYAQTALPEFAARPGTVEDALLQAMSFVAGEVVASINRLPNGLMEGVLRLLQFTRLEAQFATGTVFFTAIDDNGLSVPAGTRIAFTETVEGGQIQHVFRTLSTAFIPEGSDQSNAVTIQAEQPGEKPPLVAGQEMVILTASTRLFQSFLASTIEQGAGGETDTEYFSRGATYLASLSTGLVTISQIDAYVLTTFRQALRVKTYDLTDFDSFALESLERLSNVLTATTGDEHGVEEGDVVRVYGAGPSSLNGIYSAASVSALEVQWPSVGSDLTASPSGFIQNLTDVALLGDPDAGAVTIFVCGPAGASLTAEDKQEIKESVENKVVAGLSAAVVDALVVNIDLNISIKLRSGFDNTSVSVAVKEYVDGLLSPDQWDWSPVVRKNAVIARIAQVAGVDYVEFFEFSLDSGEPLATLNETTGDVEFSYKGVLPFVNTFVTVL
jgi:hypothetical protein